jgi:hypothetical protein
MSRPVHGEVCQSNKYVAVALSVPNCFDSFTVNPKPDLCGKPSYSWRIVSSDLWELLVNPLWPYEINEFAVPSSLNARDGGQLQLEFFCTIG